MFYVMHCGGIPFNGDTIKTKSLGGSESAAYYVAKELTSLGHSVIVFTTSKEIGTFDGVKYEWIGEVSNEAPLGDRFTFYAENTPHDVCIIQRHPRAFERKLASKQNFLWLHDLAMYRNKDAFIGQMWNVDRVLCVSQFHKEQVVSVYGIPPEIVSVVNNGVDVDLYTGAATTNLGKGLHVFYSSRPERGLINLVSEYGIMEHLQSNNITLHVCGYDNTVPQMAELYGYLWSRCEALPNVINHGALTKSQLASLQKSCDAWVYPTEFEEVSCITAMEAMTARCRVITTDVAALPETLAGTDAVLIPLVDGSVDIDGFVHALKKLHTHKHRTKYAKEYSWSAVVQNIIDCSDEVFGTVHKTSLAHHFIRHSDIKAAEVLNLQEDSTALRNTQLRELFYGYKFYRENTYAEHYAAVYQREEASGVKYGPEDVTGTARFRAVFSVVHDLADGAYVLDYGCAHGHYVVALAKHFPTLNFVGADIAQSNLDKAAAWAAALGLTNITFQKVNGVEDVYRKPLFDLIIAAEVIEHVGNPQEYIDTLATHLDEDGSMVITTPYGPWEAQGYRENGYWRAHLHHFERADLLDMLGHHPNYAVQAAPSGMSMFNSALGSYIIKFSKPETPCRPIDYLRKINHTMPDQTVSCCMIVKNAEADILRCLNSVLPHVQEVIIGVDLDCTDNTRNIIMSVEEANPLVAFKMLYITSPTKQGFAAARNDVIKHAAGDWVLWVDADEVLVNGEMMNRYLRNSMYNAFAVEQHHFSTDPVGVIKVDMPCRLFRNRLGIKFFGVVHEHPELSLNEGVGAVSVMPRMRIIHHGYSDERVRRNRFNRNLPLLARDRKENPERVLGKFLWLRDLAQSCQYDEEDGRVDASVFKARIAEGLKLWGELVASRNWRIVVDALPYYSQLVLIRGNGVDFSFMVDASVLGEANATKQQEIHGHFEDNEHALQLVTEISKDKLTTYDRRYL